MECGMSRGARGAQTNTEKFSGQQTCRTVHRPERYWDMLGYSTPSLLAAVKPVDFRSCLMGTHHKGDTGFEEPVRTTENASSVQVTDGQCTVVGKDISP